MIMASGLPELSLFCPVIIAGELTLVGPPMVGAVRMVDVAGPSETIVNSNPGQPIFERVRQFWPAGDVEVTRQYRETKEYEQLVYSVVSNDDDLRRIFLRAFQDATPKPGQPAQTPHAPESPSA